MSNISGQHINYKLFLFLRWCEILE